MIADSDCKFCGGPVGSHSDLCLDCGKDQVTFIDMWPAYAFIAVCVLVVWLTGGIK